MYEAAAPKNSILTVVSAVIQFFLQLKQKLRKIKCNKQNNFVNLKHTVEPFVLCLNNWKIKTDGCVRQNLSQKYIGIEVNNE